MALLLVIPAASCSPMATASPTATATANPTATKTPTPIPPSPTATYPPLTEATQPLVVESPLASISATPSPPPINLPFSNLTVFEPGVGSQVSSPFRVIGYSGPTYLDRVKVRLINQGETVLDETTAILMVYPGNSGRFVTHLNFDIPGVSQSALLQIDSFDRRSGRLSQRLTQPLVLLSLGSARVLPGQQGPAQLAITEPRRWALLPPGPIHVHGGGWSAWGGPIQVQALDLAGEVVDSATVTLSASQPGEIGTFDAYLNPDISFSQYGRLAVAELDPGTGEPRFMQSSEVYFQP
ncbi:MAG: hypothetical protein WBR18_02840 [Anaerolineales bacterium]